MSVLAKYLESIDDEEPRFDRTPVEPIHHLKEETYMSSNDVPALVEDTALSLSLSVPTQTFLDHLVTIEKFTIAGKLVFSIDFVINHKREI